MRLVNVVKRIAKSAVRLVDRVGLFLKRRGLGSFWLGRLLIDTILYPSDFVKVMAFSRGAFGRFPNVFRPRTFNEWISSAILFRRHHRYITYADKLLAREFVREQVGNEILTKLYWVGTDLADAPLHCLPDEFVVKANNGCGTNMFLSKDTADWKMVCDTARRWMETNHSYLVGEWQYRWIEPRLLIEQFLKDSDGNIPPDYKFFCFHGRVQLIQVDMDRFIEHKKAIFDRDFNRLPIVRYNSPATLAPVTKPACLPQMIAVAERLSAKEVFLRVDLYDLGHPVFGELTLHPNAGLSPFDPPEWDHRIFRFLDVAD